MNMLDQKTGQLNSMWYPRMDPGIKKKGYLWKTDKIWIKPGVYLLVN